MLAMAPGGACRGQRVAVLGAVSTGTFGAGSYWLVRGAPWQMGPGWLHCRAFAGSVRATGGKLVGLGGEAAQLRCGLCGGYPLGHVDQWLAGHPLSPPGARPEAM